MLEKNISHKIKVNRNLNTTEIVNLLKESLKNIGFININGSENIISFTGNQKDSALDSFQRRFVKCEFSFIQENDSITLFHKLTIPKLFKSALISDAVFLLIINILISFKGGESKTLYYIIFNIGLVFTNLIGYIVSFVLQKDKQIKLFELIEENISNTQ